MKKFLKVFSVILVVALIATIAVACNPKKNPPAEAKADSYVTVDINPSVELILDQNQMVLSVRALNEDAQVMLYNETGIIGVSVEVATQKIAELAISMGYINDENNAVSVSVSANAGSDAEKAIYAKVSASVSAAGIANSVSVSVENTVNVILSIELQKVKAANAGKEGYGDSLTVAKYRLVKSAMAYDRKLTMDVAVKMSIEELAKIVEDSHEYYKDKYNNAYEQAFNAAKRAYDNIVQTYIDGAYVQVYSERLVNNLKSYKTYGIEYQAYRLAYRTLKGTYETIEAYADNPVLTEEDISTIANNLNIKTEDYEAFKVEISDADGNVTIDSVEAYINKQHRNMNEEQREALENVYESIEDLLEDLEDNAEFISSKDKLAINATINVLNIALKVDVTISRNPEFESAIAKIEEIDDVEDILDILEDIIEDTEEAMEKDLSDAEKARVKELIASHEADVAQAKQVFENTIAQAEITAKNALQAAKTARIEANVTITVG